MGISALYRRFRSKDELLQRLCGDGLELYIAAAEAAVASDGDPGEAFDEFMRRVVEADTHSLTVALAGTFPPTEHLNERARYAGELNARSSSGPGRPARSGPTSNRPTSGLIFEQLAAVKTDDEARTGELRRRYLALFLDAIRHPTGTLPGPPPRPGEFASRWIPKSRS